MLNDPHHRKSGTHKSHAPLLHRNVQPQHKKKNPTHREQFNSVILIFYFKFPSWSINKPFYARAQRWARGQAWAIGPHMGNTLHSTDWRHRSEDERCRLIDKRCTKKESLNNKSQICVLVVAGTTLDINKFRMLWQDWKSMDWSNAAQLKRSRRGKICGFRF